MKKMQREKPLREGMPVMPGEFGVLFIKRQISEEDKLNHLQMLEDEAKRKEGKK